MGATLSQIFALLTTDAGRLTYHLVLAFSILGALYISLNQSPRQEVVQHRRLVFGFVLLLVFQLALFVVSGLADVWLPLLERAVTLLSLIIIAWMWAFPDSSPGADMAAVLLILLTITSAVLGALWWQEQATGGMDFNGSLPDKIAQAAALVIIFVGFLAIVSRRPVNWTLGLWMLLILAVGHAVQLFLMKESGDYPAVVRLAQMAAFSFLFALPLRLAPLPLAEDQAEPGEAADAQPITPASRLYADPQLWQSLPRLVSETDPERVCQTITSTVAKVMGADLCLLTMPPDESGKVVVRSGYELVRGRYLESLTLDSHSLPMLTSSLRMGRIRRLSIHGTSPDMAGLARAYNLEHTGNMLFLPVLSSDGHPLAGIIMLSPYSGKDWSHEEQSFLSQIPGAVLATQSGNNHLEGRAHGSAPERPVDSESSSTGA
jgi:GAF domain